MGNDSWVKRAAGAALGAIGALGAMAAGAAEAPILPPRPLPPVIVIKNAPPEAKPAFVAKLDATVRVTGETAETTLELTVRNPNNRVYEGEFTLPLPDGATVSGLALDINGEMIDAAIVAKARAQEVFETEIRKGVDPALVEHVGGNNYRARVYPLPADGSRRVRLKFVSSVNLVDGVPLYVLPMNYPEKIDCHLRIEVADPAAKPQVRTSAFANLQFNAWETIVVAETTLHDLALTEDLRLALAKVDNPPVFVEKAGDDCYFAARVAPEPLTQMARKFAAVNLVWDASLSRLGHDHATEFAFLKAWAAGRDLPVRVFFLRDRLEKGPEIALKNGDAAPLVDALRQTVYDGGTNFAALKELPTAADALTLLFSDGIHNFGEDKPREIPGMAHAVTVSSTADTAYLRALAAPGGGQLVNLTATPPENAAKMLANDAPAVNFRALKLDGQPVATAHAFPLGDGQWQVVGKIPAGKHEAAAEFSDAAPAAFVIDAAAPRAGTLLKTLYGMREIAAKQQAGNVAPEAFLELGREYGLVTPGTSMLVLESPAQYIQHRVRPPASMPEWVAEYDRHVQETAEKSKKESEERLADAARRYQAEIIAGWYEKTFTPRPPRKPEPPKALAGGARPGIVRLEAPEDEGDDDVLEEEPEDEEIADASDFVTNEPGGRFSARGSARVALRAAPRDAGAAPRAAGTVPNGEPAKKIQLAPWDPQAPYTAAMKAAPERAYAIYLEYRERNLANVGFFTDCADYFLAAGDKATARRVLSNLAEMELENRFILRVLGYKLRYQGDYAAAERVFRKVLELAPEEAQSYRDLALTLDDAGKFQEAATMMLNLVTRRFDSRFPNIEFIGITELNRILARAARAGATVAGVDERLRFPLEADLRVVINWDTDMSDMDLHTIDPDGEECFFSHRLTAAGGRNSDDFTQGYGPEEFMTRRARPGTYTVKTHYYGQRAQKMIGAVTLYAEVFTDYGRATEKRETLSFRLAGKDSWVEVGKIRAAGAGAPGAQGAAPAPGRDYQVKANETLADIARKELGDAARAGEILQLNPGLGDGKDLRAGTLIKLPR